MQLSQKKTNREKIGEKEREKKGRKKRKKKEGKKREGKRYSHNSRPTRLSEVTHVHAGDIVYATRPRSIESSINYTQLT
jgi:hypothetical protein